MNHIIHLIFLHSIQFIIFDLAYHMNVLEGGWMYGTCQDEEFFMLGFWWRVEPGADSVSNNNPETLASMGFLV